jgi:hypothetical protein
MSVSFGWKATDLYSCASNVKKWQAQKAKYYVQQNLIQMESREWLGVVSLTIKFI